MMQKLDVHKNIFEELFEVIKNRKRDKKDDSYTSTLMKSGQKKICKKFGEESIEVIIAALAEKKQDVVDESADTLFHLFVLWAHMEIEIDDVTDELRRRFGVSGLKEKKARTLEK